jgi:hypothetical protein
MKQWKTLGLLGLLFLASMALQAQDVVRLQDGSFVRGTILEYIAGDHVRIKTEEGKVYEYAAADIKSTESGVIQSGNVRKPIVPKTKGYYNITGLGLNLGNNYGSLSASAGFYMVNGWQWNKHLMTGLGVGLEHLDRAVRVPLTIDTRWKFGEGTITPYVGLNAGYTLSGRSNNYYYYDRGGVNSTQNKGGVTTGAQVGFMAQVAPHMGLNVSVGYRYQVFTSKYDQGFWTGTEYISLPVVERSYLNRVTLGFGLLFN